MNLADLLVPKVSSPGKTERAEGAESQHSRGPGNPPTGAEKGGETTPAPAIRPNPPARAESETRTDTAFPPNPPNPPGAMQEIEQPLPATREYLASLGLETLPEDVAFLTWHLPRGTTARNQALREYVHRWRDAMDAEPAQHRRQNRGRFAANAWLRASSLNKESRK
tara:strand:+ start:11854 stop:12354 length:501 start_codon:yes stop_codon:yes gene_type:complete